MVFFKRFVQIDPLLFLSTTILLYVLRMVGPYVNYIFIPFLFLNFLFTSCYVLKNSKSIIYSQIIKFNPYLIVISALFVWGFIISTTFIFPVFKELLNVVIILFLSSSIFLFINNKKSFDRFNKIICKQFIIFSSFVSVLGLIKFYFQLKNIEFTFLNFSKRIEGTSLTTDYNFYILFCFIGIISTLFWLKNFDKKMHLSNKAIFSVILLILSLNILLSYSRRGFILLLVMIPLIVSYSIYGYYKRQEYFSVLSSYLVSFLFLVLLFIGFLFVLPVQMKKDTLNFLGVSVRSYKYFTSTLLYRYSTIFYKPEYSYFQNIVWKEKLNPLDPDSGWGSLASTPVFPLIGENREIVPENSIGYKMNRTGEASTWNNNAYSYTDISRLFIGDPSLEKTEFYFASVYCFVSKDFDGNWARISTEGEVSGKTLHEYDLNKKGFWQKLNICFRNNGNISPVYLYWAKFGGIDFANLKGYVVFAYPEYKIVNADPRDPDFGWGSRIFTSEYPLSGENVESVTENAIGYKMDQTSNASTWNNNAYSYTDISSLFQGDLISTANNFLSSSVFCFVSKDFDGTWARISAEGDALGKTIQEYDLRKKGTWQKLQIDFESKQSLPPVYLYWSKYGVKDFSSLKGYVIFAYPEYYEKSSKTDL